MCQEPEKTRVLLMGTTGVSAVQTGGATVHAALGNKPGAKLSGLSDKAKASLRNELSEVKFLMIDKILMVSSDLWTEIDTRLSGIFSTSIGFEFNGF